MPDFLKVYGDTEGPLGFPMKDADAKAVDALMKQYPDSEFCRAIVEKATTELRDGERADVSWIQTEAVDRHGDIVLCGGFRDDAFQGNPIVTINHDYTKSPVGRSIWRKKVKEGDRRGIKAKTTYPTKPTEWNDPNNIWPSDNAWALVKSGLMGGKSIGFLTLKAHSPTDEEIKRQPELSKIRRIVDEWVLLEYCCCWLPVNPEAVVDAVSKSMVKPEELAFAGYTGPVPTKKAEVDPNDAILAKATFTPLSEIQKAINNSLGKINTKAMIEKAVQDGWDRLKGKV